jgi:prepilin-type N-terminal cleavage/methylation domain-containing protein
MKTRFFSRAFTLVELLVVIAIIGILASAAFPAFRAVRVTARQSAALGHAKQIGTALVLFAGDHDGNFPMHYDPATLAPDFSQGPPNANAAYRQLIPRYIPTETVFYVPQSRWSPNRPDDKVKSEADKLRAGENHWAYVPRLSETSHPTFPLIADGFAAGSPGTYAVEEREKGGVWQGRKAVVIRVDTSARVENVGADLKVLGPTGESMPEDIFSPASNGGDWIPAEPVNPEG